PVSTVDGGRLHLRLGTPRADLGGCRCEGPRLDEARESREEGEVRMAATVQSKGAGGGAPPSYVKTPASRFLVSFPVDRRVARYDVPGSLAHVAMLAGAGIHSQGARTL